MEHLEERIIEHELERHNKRSLISFTFLHFMNDMHSTTLPTIIPMLVESISLTLTQAGILSGIFGLMNIFGQPVFGYIADRLKRPWLAIWGPFLSVCGACLLPLSPHFGIAVLLVGCMSTGTALFHPQANGLCGTVAGPQNLAFYLSLFAAFGSFGSSIGPLYVVYITSLVGRRGYPLVLIPVLVICVSLWRRIGGKEYNEANKVSAESIGVGSFLKNVRYLMGKVGSIVVITSVRDATFQGIKVFLPMLIILRGGSIASGGFALFVITAASTVAGVIGGKLADTVGDEKVLLGSLSVAPVFLLLGLYFTETASLLAFILAYGFLYASSPVTTAMAQKRCPESRSAVSSLAMGVSWGVANLFATPVGAMADVVGLPITLNIVAFLPWCVTVWYACKKFSTKKN